MIGLKTVQYYKHENPGYVKISGPDRLDFLQRQTTNDLRQLSPGQSLVTVLTSPAGRILDVLWIIDEDEETYGVITLPGQGNQTADYLNSRIFFMDKVSLENNSDGLLQIDLFGEEISDILKELGANADQIENNLTSLMVKDVPIKVLMHQFLDPRLLIPSAHADQVLPKLGEFQLQPLSSKDYQILRIESGMPSAGHELVEDYTPLEIGLRWAISDNKGCYTGQEVIARQVNYDKVTKKLVGLSMTEIPENNETLYSREKGQPVGKVTSTVISPRFGPIALAVVKRPFHEPGADLFLRIDDQELNVVAHELPFQ
jgi:folate-binding protein YgfZ